MLTFSGQETPSWPLGRSDESRPPRTWSSDGVWAASSTFCFLRVASRRTSLQRSGRRMFTYRHGKAKQQDDAKRGSFSPLCEPSSVAHAARTA